MTAASPDRQSLAEFRSTLVARLARAQASAELSDLPEPDYFLGKASALSGAISLLDKMFREDTR